MIQPTVLRIYNCELCNKLQNGIIRDNTILLSDKDVQFIIANQDKQLYKYCIFCKFTTLQTVLGFEGVT